MIERQEQVYTFLCPHCGHEQARHVILQTRDIRYLIDPEATMNETYSIRIKRQPVSSSKIECASCAHSWNTMQQSIDEGAFRITSIRSTILEPINQTDK